MATTSSSDPKLQVQIDRERLDSMRLRELLANERASFRALKATHATDMRKAATEARLREQELRQQLNDATKTSDNDKKCDECYKIRNEYEAELRKEKNESKKKESYLLNQIKELRNFDNKDLKKTSCNECCKLRNEYEAELKKERNESKKKETSLLNQIKELKSLETVNTQKNNCSECNKIRNEYDAELRKHKYESKKKESSLLKQINEIKNEYNKGCEECTKLRNTYETNLKKERSSFKKMESDLKSQINQLKMESTSKEKNILGCQPSTSFQEEIKLLDECTKLKKNTQISPDEEIIIKNECVKVQSLQKEEIASLQGKLMNKIEEMSALRKTHEIEIKKLKQEFRNKENNLVSQINELKNSFVSDKKSACGQCKTFKAVMEADFKKERKEFKKKEEMLQAQLANVHKVINDIKCSKSDCGECCRMMKKMVKIKEFVKQLEEKHEKLQEADRLKTTELRSQRDKHITELAKVTRSATQDTRKLLEELKTKNRIIEQLRRNVQSSKKTLVSENVPMRKLRDGDRKLEATPTISPTAFDPKADNHIYDKVSQSDCHIPSRINQVDVSSQTVDGLEAELGEAEAGSTDELLEEELCPPELPLQPPPPPHGAHDHQHVLLHLKHFKKEPDRRDQSSTKYRREMYYKSSGHELEPVQEEDIDPDSGDSALSSAPTSLSPQPYSTTPCFPETPPSGQQDDSTETESSGPEGAESYASSTESPPPEDIWKRESELSIARRQVRELEKAVLVTREVKSEPPHQGHITSALQERIKSLEAKEASLLNELGDLREQNELLEFRILELEECHDKWSLRSASPPSSRRDGCTDADSGVGSVCLEPEERMRARLLAMATQAAQPEDKDTLLRVLALLDQLEQLSREQHLLGDDREQESPVQIKSQQFGYSPHEKQPNRIVATVLPFTNYQQQEEEDFIDQERHDSNLSDKTVDKKVIWTNLCLQESGIFDEDDDESLEFHTQSTQTDPFLQDPPINKPLDLTAEIQKLNQFRESIEVNKAKKLLVSPDQKYLKEINFYKDRLEVLERKLEVYESSGDVQAKLLRERLNKEIYLASQIKDLTYKVQKLNSENSRLEEERCELEEAENDTRLRCQQLEAEIETLADRLRVMEDSKLAAKRKAKDAKSQATYWESIVNKIEERNYELEERECELRHRLEVMECTTPSKLMFNMWKTLQNNPDIDMKELFIEKFKELKKLKHEPLENSLCTCANDVDDVKNKIKILETEKTKLINQKELMESRVGELEKELQSLTNITARNTEKEIKVTTSELELLKELQDKKKRITELEQREMAYMETLQQADDIWAEMETSYKKRITEAEQIETQLRQKLQKYEKPDDRDDKIQELEQNEKALQEQLTRLEKKVQQLVNSNKQAKEEFDNCVLNLEEKLSSTQIKLTSDLEKERKKHKSLADELKATENQKLEAGKIYEAEIISFKEQLSKTRKELVHLDVTNSELREEVYTLESKISEMDKEMQLQRCRDTDTIKGLSKELNSKEKELQAMLRKSNVSAPCSCARGELTMANRQMDLNVNELAKKLSLALQRAEKGVDNLDVSQSDLLHTVRSIKLLCDQVESQSTQGDVPKVPARRRWV